MHEQEFYDEVFLDAALRKDPKVFENAFGPMTDSEKVRYANLVKEIEEAKKKNPNVTFFIPNNY